MKLYQNVIQNQNFSLKTKKEFAAFYENGKMWGLRKDGSKYLLAERDDRAFLEEGVRQKRIKILTEEEYLGK